MACEEAIFKQLRESGFRLTPQREMVLSIMHQMDDFATADQIFEGVQTLSSSVDISTIYRTLDLLQDFRVVAAVDLSDGQRRYKLSEVGASARVHLVCRVCGKVIGLDLEQIRSCAVSLQEQTGFEADLDHLTVPGLCQGCRAARDTNPGVSS
jgi:Fur family ferric uptake transcriptional regulator